MKQEAEQEEKPFFKAQPDVSFFKLNTRKVKLTYSRERL